MHYQAMLTWTMFGLVSNDPGLLAEIQAEVRTVMGTKSRPDYEDIVKMKKTRMALIEALRLYPEPPVLIRRARMEDTLPPGGAGLGSIKVLRGTDIFISTWNLHRAPEYWEDPERYDPTRWERPFKNPGVKGWGGYNPDKVSEYSLYPNEVASDYAFLPFGAGKRKCIGDQFALIEACVTLVSNAPRLLDWFIQRSHLHIYAYCFQSHSHLTQYSLQSMIMNKFDFTLIGTPADVGMKTGATIHTMNGLNMMVSRRPEGPDGIPETDDWWVQQHLTRGFDVNGRPYATTEDAAWTAQSHQKGGLRP